MSEICTYECMKCQSRLVMSGPTFPGPLMGTWRVANIGGHGLRVQHQCEGREEYANTVVVERREVMTPLSPIAEPAWEKTMGTSYPRPGHESGKP